MAEGKLLVLKAGHPKYVPCCSRLMGSYWLRKLFSGSMCRPGPRRSAVLPQSPCAGYRSSRASETLGVPAAEGPASRRGSAASRGRSRARQFSRLPSLFYVPEGGGRTDVFEGT
ncbi:unnamed protein product [Ixodes pacificus]